MKPPLHRLFQMTKFRTVVKKQRAEIGSRSITNEFDEKAQNNSYSI